MEKPSIEKINELLCYFCDNDFKKLAKVLSRYQFSKDEISEIIEELKRSKLENHGYGVVNEEREVLHRRILGDRCDDFTIDMDVEPPLPKKDKKSE